VKYNDDPINFQKMQCINIGNSPSVGEYCISREAGKLDLALRWMDSAPVGMMTFNKPEGREGVMATKPALLLKSLSTKGN
jgi:hypothetical protein